tara:strand:+ start:118 stop:468 length:351 start_codon:yes stop_codon:yes gene_type:complete
MLPPVVMIRRAGEKDRGNGTERWRKGAPRPSLDPYAGTRAATQVSSSALAGSGSAGPALGILQRKYPAPSQPDITGTPSSYSLVECRRQVGEMQGGMMGNRQAVNFRYYVKICFAT